MTMKSLFNHEVLTFFYDKINTIFNSCKNLIHKKFDVLTLYVQTENPWQMKVLISPKFNNNHNNNIINNYKILSYNIITLCNNIYYYYIKNIRYDYNYY